MLFAVSGSIKGITSTNAKIEGRENFSTLIATAVLGIPFSTQRFAY